MLSDEAANLRTADLLEGLRDTALIAFGLTPDAARQSGFRSAWDRLTPPRGPGISAALTDPRIGCWVQQARRLVLAGHPELAPHAVWQDHLARFALLAGERNHPSPPVVAGFNLVHAGDVPDECVPPGMALLAPSEVTEAWRVLLTTTRAALHRLPAIESFVDQMVAALAPTRDWSGDTHFSTSTPDAPSIVFLSWSPRLEPFVEAVVHEAGHQWLYAIDAKKPVLRGAQACRPPVLPSPWRPDLRPLDGILHGAVAFDRVATWWQACRKLPAPASSPHWMDRRIETVRHQVRSALSELEAHRSYLTEEGTRIVADIAKRVDYQFEIAPPDSDELIIDNLIYINLTTITGRAALLEIEGLRAHDLSDCQATGPLSRAVREAEQAWATGDSNAIEQTLMTLIRLQPELPLAWHRVGELMRRQGFLEQGAKLLLSPAPWLEDEARKWLPG